MTEAVLADLTPLKIKEVMAGTKVTDRSVTLNLCAPTGAVRLLKKGNGALTPCTGKETIQASDLPKNPGDQGSYYLQGVSPNKQPRDTAAVLEYDPDPDPKNRKYKWKKVCRDVLWVNGVGLKDIRTFYCGKTHNAGSTVYVPAGTRLSFTAVTEPAGKGGRLIRWSVDTVQGAGAQLGSSTGLRTTVPDSS